MDNKRVFAQNLKWQMALNKKTRRDVSDAIGVSYYTFTDWVNGKKYPRMDKVEALANYFGILKSDLIEEKEEKPTIDSELTRRKTEFAAKVMQMSEAELERLEQILRIVEQRTE